MTLRRVYLSDIDRWPQQDEHDGVPYVLLTAEEYRERIREAYTEGALDRGEYTNDPLPHVAWKRSNAKRLLDEMAVVFWAADRMEL
jgi:hypothetical protein